MPLSTRISLNILVIDDEALCARALTSMLQHLGPHRVVTANNGAQAAELLDGEPFDLILCDLRMPGCDGIETLRLFAERNIRSSIVLLSGSDARLLRSAKELGRSRGLAVIGTLTKPISLLDLEDLLFSMSSGPRPAKARRIELQSSSELQSALERGELRLHYQPQLDLRTQVLTGVEALVRWEHPERGLVMPDTFIPVAEESGLIEPLTEWVVCEAINQASRWRRAGLAVGVSVNLSARTLKRLDLPDRLAAFLLDAGLAPAEITLEVTESGVSDDIEALLDITTRLRLKGFPLSIDDFGTGFSNLEQLQHLPFSELKLDRRFVHASLTEPDAASMLRASVDLAKQLQLETVAEGIESEAEWALLERLGVERGQGFYMARPMPGADLEGWLTSWRSQVA